MQVQTLEAGRSRLWVAGGWELFSRDRGLWIGMALVYLAIALVFDQIEFIGYLLLVWITPVFAAGAIVVADGLERDPPPARAFTGTTLRERLRAGFGRSVAALFQVFWQPEKTLGAMIIGTLALGGTVVIQILSQMLQVGGAAIPAMLSGGVGPGIWAPAILSLLLVVILRLALILIALYAVHFVVLENQLSLPAIEHSGRALGRNPLPLAVFGVVFLVPMFLSASLGTLGAFAVHLLLLPLFLTSVYVSHKDLYA